MKLRKFLARANQDLSLVDFGKNITYTGPANDDDWPDVPEWSLWEDFSKDNVDTLLGDILDAEFDLPADPYELPAVQRQIANKSPLESVVIQHNAAIINAALGAVATRLDLRSVVCLSSGALAQANFPAKNKPDWSGVRANCAISASSRCANQLPGETKYAHGVFPSTKEASWDHYDKEVQNAPDLVAVRATGTVHLRRKAGLDAVEVAIVPWNARSEEHLTLNLCLFVLLLLATLKNNISESYPGIQEDGAYISAVEEWVRKLEG